MVIIFTAGTTVFSPATMVAIFGANAAVFILPAMAAVVFVAIAVVVFVAMAAFWAATPGAVVVRMVAPCTKIPISIEIVPFCGI